MTIEGIGPDEAAEVISDFQRGEREDPGHIYLRVTLDITLVPTLEILADEIMEVADEVRPDTLIADELTASFVGGLAWIDQVRTAERIQQP